jgi:sec-independent protein translocase protein TatC
MYKIEKYFEELFRRTVFFIFSFVFTFIFFYCWSFDLFIFLSESLFEGILDSSFEQFNRPESLIIKDLKTHKFIFTDITEAFHTSLGISFTSTLCLQIPFLLYTFWAFLVPSFLEKERKVFTFFCFLFLGVYSLAWYLMIGFVFPKVWEFFLTFQLYDSSIHIECEPRISSFSSFLWKTFLFTQAIFQIPFWLFVSLFYEYLHISLFFDYRRFIYWILLSFSAFTAPPDLFVQFYLSLFFICLFEITLLSALILQTYRHQKN